MHTPRNPFALANAPTIGKWCAEMHEMIVAWIVWFNPRALRANSRWPDSTS
jgi:hypothetical protein